MRNTVTSYSQVGCTEFPLPKLFSRYVNSFEKHLAQSYQVLHMDVTLCKLSRKHVSMFQNKSEQWTNCSNSTSCGRWQDAECLEPARSVASSGEDSLGRRGTKDANDHSFLATTILFCLYLPHPNPVGLSVKKMKV